MAKYSMVFVTTPSARVSARLASLLVRRRLAACVNVVPGLRSLYRWKGKVLSAREELLVVKTLTSRLGALEKTVREAHPYEVCEVLALGVQRGSAPYLDWISSSLAPRKAKKR